jgi:hypothetical protein
MSGGVLGVVNYGRICSAPNLALLWQEVKRDLSSIVMVRTLSAHADIRRRPGHPRV